MKSIKVLCLFAVAQRCGMTCLLSSAELMSDSVAADWSCCPFVLTVCVFIHTPGRALIRHLQRVQTNVNIFAPSPSKMLCISSLKLLLTHDLSIYCDSAPKAVEHTGVVSSLWWIVLTPLHGELAKTDNTWVTCNFLRILSRCKWQNEVLVSLSPRAYRNVTGL